MVDAPLVSVLINNYNYGRFVGEAIASALAQTYPGVEVIVVDDGSTDDSREEIAAFQGRIKAVLQANGGQAAALNAGFAASKGAWILLLDSDDLFAASKVERIVDLASSYPTAGLIAHDLEYCTTDGGALDFASPYIKELRLVDDRQIAKKGKLSVSLPATSGLCIRRDAFEALFPLPREIRIGVDNYIKWVLLSLFPVLIVPEKPAKQRIHGRNAGTIIAETGGALARVRLATQDAIIAYHMKKSQPHLRKLAWKQFGRILYGLRSCKTAESREVERNIRKNYSVIEASPLCFFYVAAAFTKAYAKDVLSSNKVATRA